MGNPFKFGNAPKNNDTLPETIKATMEGPFPTFWAVEDPVIVQDSVPRELRNTAAKGGISVPNKVGFQMFESFELATQYAQRQNRPLLVLEMNVAAKVVPQLPLIQNVTDTKSAA